MKVFVIIIGILWMTLGSGIAQTLTVEEYRAKVLDYNQDIKQSREAVKAAIYALKGVKTGFFPKLQLSGNYSYQVEDVEFMQGVDLKHNNYSAEAALSQNVYAGSMVRKQQEAAKLQKAIARLGEELTTDNIVYAADVSYWTLAANESLFYISQEFVLIVKELDGIVQKRFDEGAISKTDLLMVKTRLKEAELQESTRNMNYQTAMQSFKIMMGVPLEEKWVIIDSIQKPVIVPGLQSLEVALKRRADYQIAVQDFNLTKQQTKIIRSKYLPQLAVGVKETWGTPLINVSGDEKFATVAFAKLSMPIFNWGEKRQYVKQNRAMETSKELAMSKVEDQVKEELANAWVKLNENWKQVEIANSTLEIARENLKLNTFSYNEGKLPILDVLSSQATWLQAYTNVVSANYQYKVAYAEYVRILGGR
ncbi:MULTISPECIES: TolC family protein [Butyricimonas]|jgi:outer membrane efflux protein|uniref:Outer membrane protein TolC n=1 Tax=Butyricimonas faecihominis TaxID=1472416 RepID=A0A7W6MY36_9BACT|nr:MULTISPECIES: TolC family protein [Butyricimonas]KAB1501365.1 TolC family protein [Butyricimonas faecihominis]MBB4025609.1 outer membrane protein TolC [Butyricimonas faecihominis]MBS6689280.1 TolC family protein [Sanguibacteroides justesenii]WOF07572.1 TolC family protein [Butyricimonas faecihominis]